MPICFAELGKKGRLGNILFQAAATIALALRNNDIYQFPKTWIDRKYFNIPEVNFVDKLLFSQTYNEANFHYTEIPNQSNLNLSGYFQSYLYFNDYADYIKKIFQTYIKIDKTEYTSIHVRRTDYLIHDGCYNLLNRNNYYDKAMYLSNSNKFLIFSDDIKWCKENFTGNMFDFSEGNDMISDFVLMKSCSNNIIANSSFSWWSAWLNENETRSVICPSIWFGPKLAGTHNSKDLCPIEWIKI